MSAATIGTRPEMSPPATLARGAGIGIGLALVLNLIVYAVGNAGAPLQVVANGDTIASDLPAGAVVLASTVPLLLGTVGLGLLQKFLAKGTRIWVILVGALTVASVAGPLALDVDSGSQVALIVMHLATGAVAIVGHTMVRRTKGVSQ